MTDQPHVTVGPARADIIGTTNAEVQAAVERVAALGGGVVEILPGVYEMHDSLHLRSGVTVRGAGEETVLRKAPSVQSALSAYLGYGHFDVSLAEPDKFRVGMGVHIADQNSGGFYGTVATLTWRDGDRFGINRMLNHDYHPERGGAVTSVFPVVSGYHLSGARLVSLAIDGNAGENAHLNGCRGGGVFLLQAHDVALRGVSVRRYNGDGISFQQCARTLIEECTVEANTGTGLHPGSGSVAPVMRRCRCLNNGADGIFYCLRVSYSLCEECEIAGNGRDGISIGGRDTDHLIRGNAVSGSGRHAVFFRPGDAAMGAHRNHLDGNRFTGSRGEAAVFIPNETYDVHLLGNEFACAGGSPVGLRVADRCRRIVASGNRFDPEFATAIDAQCPISLDPPVQPLRVGPECVPEGWYRHLGHVQRPLPREGNDR